MQSLRAAETYGSTFCTCRSILCQTFARRSLIHGFGLGSRGVWGSSSCPGLGPDVKETLRLAEGLLGLNGSIVASAVLGRRQDVDERS